MATRTHTAPAYDTETTISSRQLMLAFGALFLLNLLLRVFYIRYDFVNGDEGIRALTAVRMIEGARLYADVVTDKTPGASLFYAGVFAAFGRSMKAVHVAAILLNFGTSIIVHLIAARLYGKRVGLWAALLFVYFSTNYFTQDMMAANTELLMVLPYAASLYFFMLGSEGRSGASRNPASSNAGVLILAGVLTGIATMFKQIGVFNLIFFGLYEVIAAWRSSRAPGVSIADLVRRVFGRLLLVGFGFLFVLLLFVVWLASMHALTDFWRNAIVSNRLYIDPEPSGMWLKFLIGRGAGYVLFNATMWLLAALAVWRSARRADRLDNDQSIAATRRYDLAIALWGLVSLVPVLISGRFFGHYFIPALPALSLLAARGATHLSEGIQRGPSRRPRIAVAVLVLLFLPGFFRSHHRTAVLAYETVSGTRTRWSENWGMTQREHEAAAVSEFVRARLRPGEPLYIWGYAHDVFWRTGCRPASRYLTPSFIDGRFPDAEGAVSPSGELFRREAAANLLDDLRRTKPRLILDIEGGFRALDYVELVDFVNKNYREAGTAGVYPLRPFLALQLNDAADAGEGEAQ